MGALGLTYWLEHWLDFASVQATLLSGAGMPLSQRMRGHLRFYRRVQI